MEKYKANILVIDDDPAVLTTAKIYLKQKFEYVATLPSPENMDKVLGEVSIDLVLLDMNYTKGENDGEEGLAIIEKLVKDYPELEVVPITAYGEVELAVEAMKRGARDFIAKPWRNEKLLATISNILKLKQANHEIEVLKAVNKQMSGDSESNLIGTSPKFLKMLETIEKVAPTDANVLISGENGTGKELVAHAIHQKSLRHNQPFQKVDLGSLSKSLFESELFGHVKGAFTDAREDRIGKFELANSGTLFLDEIGNIDASQQSKLLTAIQGRTITRIGSNKAVSLDVRFISATNVDLPTKTQSGEFRQDLLYRINTIEIHVPELRERKEDISLLSEHYLEKYKLKYNKPQARLTKKAIEALEDYNWPGNIRELTHVIERAVILAEEKNLTPSSFNLSGKKIEQESENLNIQDMEKTLILKSLEKNKGNITHAAKDLGIDRLALYRRLEKYGL